MGSGAQKLRPLILISQAHWQGVGIEADPGRLEAKQQDFKSAPTWDAGIADSSLTCSATRLAPS